MKMKTLQHIKDRQVRTEFKCKTLNHEISTLSSDLIFKSTYLKERLQLEETRIYL